MEADCIVAGGEFDNNSRLINSSSLMKGIVQNGVESDLLSLASL